MDVYFARLALLFDSPLGNTCSAIRKNQTNPLIVTKPCNEPHRFVCKRTIGNSWSQWSSWLACRKCFEHNVTRTRDCVSYNANGTNYCKFYGERLERKVCNEGSCMGTDVEFPVGACNATCGKQGWATQQIACKKNRPIQTNCKGIHLVKCNGSCNPQPPVTPTTTSSSTTISQTRTSTTETPPTSSAATTNKHTSEANLTTTVGTSNNSFVTAELTTVGMVPAEKNMYIIVACVIGALFVVVILIVVIACFMKKKRYAKQVISSVPGAPVHRNSNHDAHEMGPFNNDIPTPDDLEANGRRESPDGISNKSQVETEHQGEEPHDIYDRVPDENHYETADDVTTKFIFPSNIENTADPETSTHIEDYDEIKETTTKIQHEVVEIQQDKTSDEVEERPLLQDSADEQNTTTVKIVDDIGYDTMEEVQAEMTKLQIKQGISPRPQTPETMTIPRKFAPGTIPNEVNYDEVILKESQGQNNNIGEPVEIKFIGITDNSQSTYEQIPDKQDNFNGYKDEQDLREAYDNLPVVKSTYSSLSLDRIHALPANVPPEQQFATIDYKISSNK
uniref:Uncharacterized protein LOC100179634 n=1 Tax=Phallusia mammillata TaxID=59560 RepID=A0A6F9DH96_9ASCI|nr:uncharacterized protein LOC100179634 [Phallusia mammillata]